MLFPGNSSRSGTAATMRYLEQGDRALRPRPYRTGDENREELASSSKIAAVPTPRRGEILLLLGAIVFVLLVAEAAVRIAGADRTRATGYAPVDTNRRFARPVNARGYRDLPRVVPKPAGVKRVLSLGDSFAWGASVEFEDDA